MDNSYERHLAAKLSSPKVHEQNGHCLNIIRERTDSIPFCLILSQCEQYSSCSSRFKAGPALEFGVPSRFALYCMYVYCSTACSSRFKAGLALEFGVSSRFALYCKYVYCSTVCSSICLKSARYMKLTRVSSALQTKFNQQIKSCGSTFVFTWIMLLLIINYFFTYKNN